MIVKKIMILAVISVAFLLTLSPTSFADVVQDGMITGVVWDDINQNDIQEISEAGIDDVTVYVQNQETNEQMTTLTTEGGGFVVLGLQLGSYLVWYEYGDTTADAVETELDELNGVTSVNFSIDTSVIQASINYTIYLPLIQK